MWGILLLFYFVTGSQLLSIPEFSVPHAVEYGDNVTLNCKYELNPEDSDKSLFVKWWWTPINGTSDKRSYLYQRIAGHLPAVTRKDIGINDNDSISLLNVTPENSGTYECEVSNIDEVRKHSELIVYKLGDGPALNISVNVSADGPDDGEDPDVSMLVTCRAEDVAPEPNLIITVNGNIVKSEKMLEQSGNNTYDIEESIYLSEEETKGAEITCTLVIDQINITHPHVDVQQYFDPSALTTTEDAEEAFTTETPSDPLQYSNAGYECSSCALLVIATFLFQLLAIN